MLFDELATTMEQLLKEGKGFLAADESTNTIGKRFAAINVDNSEENRKKYRLLLAQTPNLHKYINGVILFEETFLQHDAAGDSVAAVFAKQGIIPGIKVDKGLVKSPSGEQVTQGLDGLTERLQKYKDLGARFAKWRNVYKISEQTPSLGAIKSGAENLARYAAICQSIGIVPIVEPEILIEGDHPIELCAEVSAMVLHELFHALYIHQVELEFIILKPSMITCGIDNKPFSSAQEIADFTLSVFENHVPAAVPSINFLSGGQSPKQATENLNAINQEANQPWILSFSFGRALQEACLKAWGGLDENITTAQQVLLKSAENNSNAAMGEYSAQS